MKNKSVITIDTETLHSVQSAIELIGGKLIHPHTPGAPRQAIDDFTISFNCQTLCGLLTLREQALNTMKKVEK